MGYMSEVPLYRYDNVPSVNIVVALHARFGISFWIWGLYLQRYLAHKKQRPPRALQ